MLDCAMGGRPYDNDTSLRIMPSAQFIDSVAANVAFWSLRATNQAGPGQSLPHEDRRNLFRAAEFGIGLSATWRETAELLLSLRDVIDQGVYWIEWIPVLEGLIARCEEPDQALKCRLLSLVGFLYQISRQLDLSLERLLEAEAIAGSLLDVRLLARCHIELSRLHIVLRNHQRVDYNARKALAEYQQLGRDPRMVGSCYMNIGLAAQSQGKMDEAEFNMRQAVSLFSTVHDPVNLARALHDLGIILDAVGQSHEALEVYLRAESLLAPTGSELDKTLVLLSLGTLYFRQDRLDLAEASYLKANSPFLRHSNHHYQRALAANNLGNVYLAQGRLDEAECWLAAAIRLWHTACAGLMLANTLGDMAEVKINLGQPAAAVPLFDEAIIITEAYPDDAWARDMHGKFVAARAALAVTSG
jgi:tetratricopeptide (TPR) repeat protein